MSDDKQLLLKIAQDKVDAFHKAAQELIEAVEPLAVLAMPTQNLITNIKFYQIIKYMCACGVEVERVANVIEPTVAERISKHLAQEDMDKIEVGGYTYAPDTKTYVSLSADKAPALIAAFKANPLTREYVKESIHPKTLESYVKKEIAEGRTVNPLISVCEKPTLTVRKVRGS